MDDSDPLAEYEYYTFDQADPEEEDGTLRRTVMKWLAGIGLLGSSWTGMDPEDQHVRHTLESYLDRLHRVDARDDTTARDLTALYLGDISAYDFGGLTDEDDKYGLEDHDVLASGLDAGEIEIALVYLDEEVSRSAFERRMEQEYRNYVENLDTFFGLDGLEGKAAYVAADIIDDIETEYNKLTGGVPEDYVQLDRRVLEDARDYLESVYDELLAGRDVDVSVTVDVVQEDELDGYGFDDIVLPNPDRDALSAFKEEFGYTDTLPVIMSTRDMGYAFDGRARDGDVFVHLPVITLLSDTLNSSKRGRIVEFLLGHETGHAVFNLPHNAYRDGFMSYNKAHRTHAAIDGDLTFSRRSKRFVDRLLAGAPADGESVADEVIAHTETYFRDMVGDQIRRQSIFDRCDTKAYDPETDTVNFVWSYGDTEIGFDVVVSRPDRQATAWMEREDETVWEQSAPL